MMNSLRDFKYLKKSPIAQMESGADVDGDLSGFDYIGVDPLVEGRDINTMCCSLADSDKKSALMVAASEGRFKFCVYGAAPHSKISFRRSG